MKGRPEPINSYERGLLARIDEFGWSVTSVADPQNMSPPFSYSIGMYERFEQPEVLVIGQRPQLGLSIVNTYGHRLKASEYFVCGRNYAGFLLNFDVTFIDIDAEMASKTYTLSARWFYRGTQFPLRQVVWPDKSGNYPWDAGWRRDFDSQQPILGAPPRSTIN